MIRPKGNGTKLKSNGFSNTASGKLNAKHMEAEPKLIHLTDASDDVRVSEIKTLKKPIPKAELKELEQTMNFNKVPEDRMMLSL
jgi:hypothetical protein